MDLGDLGFRVKRFGEALGVYGWCIGTVPATHAVVFSATSAVPLHCLLC